jgi:fucose 4-O-acetylase-like acetyltransferase
MSNRLTHIDVAKGICIILVVIGHYIPDNSPQWYLTLIDVIYSFHMPLFMFASGLIYHATKKPVKYDRFVMKKFKRLGIPYILVSWLIISIKLLTEKKMYVENPVSFSSFYEILYTPSAGFFLWFVYVLFLIFLIIPFFNTPRKINFLLLLSLICLLIPVPTTELFCIAQLKAHLFYFVSGCFVSQYQGIIHKKTERISVFIFLTGFIVLYLLSSLFDNVSTNVMMQCIKVLLALTGICFTLKISRFITIHTQNIKHVFVKLAMYSYTIYLFHTTFEGVAKSFFVKYPLTGYLSDTVSFCIAILVTVSVGVAGPIVLHQAYSRFKKVLKKT